MIQPATLPTAAKLPAATSVKTDKDDDAGLSAQFSALLVAAVAAPAEAGSEEAGAAAHVKISSKPGLRPAGSKHSGKAGGKFLPDSPALAAFTALLRNLRGTGQPDGDQSSAQAKLAPTMMPTPSFPLVDAIPVAAEPSPITSTPSHTIALAAAIPPTGNDPTGGELVSAVGLTPDRPAAGALETAPIVIENSLTNRMLILPKIQHPIVDLANMLSEAPEPDQSDAAATQIAPLHVRQLPEVTIARVMAARGPDSTEISTGKATSDRPLSIAGTDPERPLEPSRTILAAMDAAPLSLAHLTPALASSQAMVATLPQADPRTPDFTALIDRLVEARQASQATSQSHTVNAAVNHAEFGQVSLQFRHDAEGLSVLMASTDPAMAPDLARAVLAASPSAGHFGGQFDGNAPSSRHDGGGQQSAGTSQAQSQAQQRGGQSAQHGSDAANNSANPSSRSRSPAHQGARSGIFA
jgi:hypothetical protein